MKKNYLLFVKVQKCTLSIFAITSIILAVQVSAYAQIDTIDVRNNELNIDQLKTGTSQYLVYIQHPNGAVLDASIWERTVRFGERNDQETIVISQVWKNQDQTKTKQLYSINKARNFAPIYHKTISDDEINAFDFYENKIVGSDSVQGSFNSDFSINHPDLTLNWELDMEIFSTLPYALGKEFYINFYHPGSKNPPKYHKYKVVDEATLSRSGNTKIECWILQIEYSSQNKADFWISKETFEMIQMIETAGPIKRYKKIIG